jgi:hypothetical protein
MTMPARADTSGTSIDQAGRRPAPYGHPLCTSRERLASVRDYIVLTERSRPTACSNPAPRLEDTRSCGGGGAFTMGRVPKPIAAVLAFLLGVGACSGGDKDTVSLGTVALRTVNEVVEAPGTVTARASATITAPATGTVKQLSVEDGQRVRAGTVVLVIDSPAAQEQLQQAQQADEQVARAGAVWWPGPG